MSVAERFPGELATLRADNLRLRRLLEISEEQACAARPDQATRTGAPTAASAARRIATSLLGEAFWLRGSMQLRSYDRLFPSQDVHTGRGVGNLVAAR